MDFSRIFGPDNLVAGSTFDALAKQLADDDRWRARMVQDFQASASKLKAMEEVQASIRSMQLIVPDSLTRMVDQQQKLMRDAMGPLAQLRASSIFKSVLDEAMGGSRFKSIIDERDKAFALANAGMHESIREVFKNLGFVNKSLLELLNPVRPADLAVAAGPFASIRSELERNRSNMSTVLDAIGQGDDWSRSLRLPVIDAASAAAVARVWGEAGLLAQVRSLGLDSATLSEFVRRVSEGEAGDEYDLGEAEVDGKGRLAPKPLSLMDWLSIFGVFLAILVPIWQKMDSDATEARLTSEIRSAEERNSKRIEALTRLLESMVERSQSKVDDQMFVVRSRVALIRRFGTVDSAVEAEVFPNQVVKVVSERGKWIEVEYFDWLAREKRTGWALKKYFVRVPTSQL